MSLTTRAFLILIVLAVSVPIDAFVLKTVVTAVHDWWAFIPTMDFGTALLISFLLTVGGLIGVIAKGLVKLIFDLSS